MPTTDIYLDHAATTPVDPVVTAAMQPWFTERFGNPSSIYQLGQDARAAIELSRQQCATVLGCHPSEIVFTSGATESNNQTLLNIMLDSTSKTDERPHLITSAIEHHAVLHPAEWLEQRGIDVTVLPVDTNGIVDPDNVRRAIGPSTRMISLMYANNEVGSVQPIAAVGSIARERGVLFHTDAVQAAGQLPLNVNALGVDFLSLSAHKFYGPKAVGLLFARKGSPLAHLQMGGGQESGRRGGTENVPGIVGLGMALQIAEAGRESYGEHCRTIRDGLWEGLQEQIGGITLNGAPTENPGARLANNLNVAIEGVQGETVLLNLDMLGIAASAGSACTTGNTQPSHVLTAMGLSAEHARSSIRLTTGRCNRVEDVAEVVDAFASSVSRIRQLAG
ncbi:MAG: cysteine desulfurase [Thermomicrobiales bacterium]|nr:cysteine desulfurase [Thermomicrobiales bacterium]